MSEPIPEDDRAYAQLLMSKLSGDERAREKLRRFAILYGSAPSDVFALQTRDRIAEVARAIRDESARTGIPVERYLERVRLQNPERKLLLYTPDHPELHGIFVDAERFVSWLHAAVTKGLRTSGKTGPSRKP